MEALNQKERKFAEEHHALIYAFLRCYHLPEAEYYDLLAIAYLRAVKEYNSKPLDRVLIKRLRVCFHPF